MENLYYIIILYNYYVIKLGARIVPNEFHPTQKFVWLGCLDVGADDVCTVSSRVGVEPLYPSNLKLKLLNLYSDNYNIKFYFFFIAM